MGARTAVGSDDGSTHREDPDETDLATGLTPERADHLRDAARARIGADAAAAPPADELQHELRVQQAELEIQNEELRDVELSLEQSRREFFALYDLAPVGYVTIDASGIIQRANLTAAEMLGADRFRLAGRPLAGYLVPRESTRLFEHIGDVLLDKRTATCELEFGSAGSTTFHARVTSSPAPASLDAEADIFLTLVDISDRVEAERKVRDREVRLRAIVDHAPLGIALLDEHDRIRECNEAFERQVEQRGPEVIDRPLDEFVVAADQPRLSALLRLEGRAVEPHLRVGPRATEVRAWTTTFDAEREHGPGRLVLFEDVSEATRAAERAAFLEGELVSVHQEKLQALGQLAGGVAHDFNNMLAAIMAFAECSLLTEDLPATVEEDLAGIRDASLRARSLVREVLTFARRRRPVRGPARLRTLLEGAVALVKGAAPSGIHLSHACPSEAMVFVDEGQIQQMLVNLLTNAIQAIGMDNGRIEVSVESVDLASGVQSDGSEIDAGRYWRISVQDDGPGIPSEVLDRVFEPFFTTRQRSGGCGMGLATAQSVAELHGGLLEVSSEIGFGSTFRLFLPEVIGEERSDMVIAHVPEAYSGEVLLVDDEELVRRSSRRLLMGLGARVELCGRPGEAIERIREAPARFDVVITDLSMPEMTGTQLAAKLNEIAPDLPVLLLTGNRGRIDQDMLSGVELSGIVEKPLSRSEISEVLARLPKRSR